MATKLEPEGRLEPNARRRIVDSAYELFSPGVRATGVDQVIERAGVVKATRTDLSVEGRSRRCVPRRREQFLMKGSIVQAGEGDREAAKRAKVIARVLLAEYRCDAS